MKNIYNEILEAKRTQKKLLAILLDPDKINFEELEVLLCKINQSPATHIFIGGSVVHSNCIEDLIEKIKCHCLLPIVLFPGNPSQIACNADGILFLSLISGRNPDYLIEHQVQAVPFLQKTQLEIISTGYILVESQTQTAVEKVSNTKPLSRTDIEKAVNTAMAGEFLGNKLIYLEAGSGARLAVPLEMIQQVCQNVSIPVIVGGGIVSARGIEQAYQSGATMVVIGTAFENDTDFFNSIC